MNKIGFVHLPRTGGTYIESLIANKGPEFFINFFGTPGNQNANRISLIENISTEKNSQEKLLAIPNWTTAQIFSGHFSLNIIEYLPRQYNYDYITVIRDPVDRTYSFIKKVTTSKTFKSIITQNNKYSHKDLEFWDNFINYYNSSLTSGLGSHEIHGFSNYMTKVYAGCDLTKTIVVDEDIYQKARENLKTFKYIGIFEDYGSVVKSFIDMFDLNVRYDIKENSSKTKKPEKISDFLKSINSYDYMLYEEFK